MTRRGRPDPTYQWQYRLSRWQTLNRVHNRRQMAWGRLAEKYDHWRAGDGLHAPHSCSFVHAVHTDLGVTRQLLEQVADLRYPRRDPDHAVKLLYLAKLLLTNGEASYKQMVLCQCWRP